MSDKKLFAQCDVNGLRDLARYGHGLTPTEKGFLEYVAGQVHRYLEGTPSSVGEFREVTPEERAREHRSIDIQQLSTGHHFRIVGLSES